MQSRKGQSVAKEIARKIFEGKVVDKTPESKGIPAGNRGTGSGNSGAGIKNWRAGRGAV